MSFDFKPEYAQISQQNPFRFWVQKVIPLVYDDSLSYYELLGKVVSHLNNTMENVLKLGQNCGSMFEGYNELKDYVNKYYDSLEVQQEINNKLDEMAANGDLTAIIASFLELTTARIFSTVADMVAESNAIKINSIVRCLGFYDCKDGGGCYYRISRKYSDYCLTLKNSLFAEPLILEDYVTPLQFGAKGDNSTDDTSYINKALKYGYDNKKYLCLPFGKTFLISTPINVHSMENYKIVNNGTIHAKAYGNNDTSDTTDYQYMAFSIKYSSNIDIHAGYIYSERIYYENPPKGHTSELPKGSNVCGVACWECSNITIHDYKARNLEYAFGCLGYPENNIYNDNIEIRDFDIAMTSQPIFGSYTKNISIKYGKMEEAPKMGRGHHFIYLSSVKNARIECVQMKYTTGHYGTALNFANAANAGNSPNPSQYDDTTDPTQVDIFNVVIDNCYQPISVKAKTIVNIFSSVFTAFDGAIPQINNTWIPTIFCGKEYSTINCYNSVFNFDERYNLQGIPSLLHYELNLNNCKVKCGSIFTVGASNSSENKCTISAQNTIFDFVGVDNNPAANIMDTASYNFHFYECVVNSDKKFIIRVNYDSVEVTAINTTLNYSGENGAFISLYKSSSDYYTPAKNIRVCNFVGKNCGSVCNQEKYAENIVKNNNFLYTEDTE